jgi:hypothetical protein
MSAFLIWNSAHLTEDHSLMDLEFARSMAATCCLLVKMKERVENKEVERAMVRIDQDSTSCR